MDHHPADVRPDWMLVFKCISWHLDCWLLTGRNVANQAIKCNREAIQWSPTLPTNVIIRNKLNWILSTNTREGTCSKFLGGMLRKFWKWYIFERLARSWVWEILPDTAGSNGYWIMNCLLVWPSEGGDRLSGWRIGLLWWSHDLVNWSWCHH